MMRTTTTLLTKFEPPEMEMGAETELETGAAFEDITKAISPLTDSPPTTVSYETTISLSTTRNQNNTHSKY